MTAARQSRIGSRRTKAQPLANGFFITFEGGEGAGKSTQVKRLAAKLRAKKYDVVVTREPGGSPGAEAVRHVLLSGAAEPFGPGMEALLFAAARSDHVEQVIRPAVARGAIVLCDRFMDSSRVYQGVTGGLDPAFMRVLERVAINGMVPDLTLIFDLDAAEGLRLATHQQRRDAFLAIAAAEPGRCTVIDASGDAETVENRVTAAVFAALEAKRPAINDRQAAPA